MQDIKLCVDIRLSRRTRKATLARRGVSHSRNFASMATGENLSTCWMFIRYTACQDDHEAPRCSQTQDSFTWAPFLVFIFGFGHFRGWWCGSLGSEGGKDRWGSVGLHYLVTDKIITARLHEMWSSGRNRDMQSLLVSEWKCQQRRNITSQEHRLRKI